MAIEFLADAMFEEEKRLGRQGRARESISVRRLSPLMKPSLKPCAAVQGAGGGEGSGEKEVLGLPEALRRKVVRGGWAVNFGGGNGAVWMVAGGAGVRYGARQVVRCFASHSLRP